MFDAITLDGPGSRPWKSETCWDCRHYRGARVCSAYPGGIPENVWQTYRGHRSPIDGDNGIQYEQDTTSAGSYDIPEFLRKK